MDVKQIRKKLQTSNNNDKQNTIDQRAIAEKSIKDVLKYREKRLEEIKNDKKRILNFQKKVKDYNEKKFKEYNDVLEALKESSKDYYQYYKKYEKEHGWKKTTRVLKDHNLMKEWIDFSTSIPILIKVATRAPSPDKISPPIPDKISPPESLPSETLPKKEIPLPTTPKTFGEHLKEIKEIKHPELFGDLLNLRADEVTQEMILENLSKQLSVEDQYIYEEKMEENLLRDSDMQYIKYRMLRAGFSEEQVAYVAEELTHEERLRLVDRLQREAPIDDDTDIITTTPTHGQYADEWAQEAYDLDRYRITCVLDAFDIWW